MKTHLLSEIEIDAPPQRVWQVLTDLSAYPDWNPFIVRAEGRALVGSRLALRMQPVGGRPLTLRPTVVEATESARFSWRGTVGIPGLLDAEHVFRITERANGGSRLNQDEQFQGVLVPLMAKSLRRKTLPAFVAMNEALKQRAERIDSAIHG